MAWRGRCLAGTTGIHSQGRSWTKLDLPPVGSVEARHNCQRALLKRLLSPKLRGVCPCGGSSLTQGYLYGMMTFSCLLVYRRRSCVLLPRSDVIDPDQQPA